MDAQILAVFVSGCQPEIGYSVVLCVPINVVYKDRRRLIESHLPSDPMGVESN